MPSINYLAVILAAVAAFMVGAVWYSPLLFGKAYAELRGLAADAVAATRPPIGELLGEFARNLVVAVVLAGFAAQLSVGDWKAGLQLGACVWVGFQAMLLLGAPLHEGMPWKLYALHAGDALVKTLLQGVIIGAWRG